MVLKTTSRWLMVLILLTSFLPAVRSQVAGLTLDTIPDYNGWGWEALVIRNEYITVAVIPQLGGNILQYDFGIDTFLILNPRTFGQTYEAGSGNSPFSNDWGIGGYQVWPTPESWPPPPFLTYRAYSSSVQACTSDSVTLMLTSSEENTSFPGILFERRITVYGHSTRVRVQNSMVNQNTQPVHYGMMLVAEAVVNHDNRADYANFTVHFPVHPESRYGSEGVRINPASAAFTGQLTSGIYTVQYLPDQGKVFADVSDGWCCYMDKADSQAYFRLFEVFEEEAYPDEGARLEVYVEDDPHFLAIETLSPLKTIYPNGGRYTFEDNLYALKLDQPAVKATKAGAVTKRLTYDSIHSVITGAYGVFNACQLRLRFYDENHLLLDSGSLYSVTPAMPFILTDTLELPVNSRFIELTAVDHLTGLMDVLDYIDLFEENETGIPDVSTKKSSFFVLTNSLTHEDMLECRWENQIPGSPVMLELMDYAGRRKTLLFHGFMPDETFTFRYPLRNIGPGLYFIISRNNSQVQCEKMIVTE